MKESELISLVSSIEFHRHSNLDLLQKTLSDVPLRLNYPIRELIKRYINDEVKKLEVVNVSTDQKIKMIFDCYRKK